MLKTKMQIRLNFACENSSLAGVTCSPKRVYCVFLLQSYAKHFISGLSL